MQFVYIQEMFLMTEDDAERLEKALAELCGKRKYLDEMMINELRKRWYIPVTMEKKDES